MTRNDYKTANTFNEHYINIVGKGSSRDIV